MVPQIYHNSPLTALSGWSWLLLNFLCYLQRPPQMLHFQPSRTSRIADQCLQKDSCKLLHFNLALLLIKNDASKTPPKNTKLVSKHSSDTSLSRESLENTIIVRVQKGSPLSDVTVKSVNTPPYIKYWVLLKGFHLQPILTHVNLIVQLPYLCKLL